MSPARAKYHHGDLRNALVKTAYDLVEKQGAEVFSLRRAAASLGVSANAVYRHFKDKKALLCAVSAEGFHRLSKQMQRALAREVGEVSRFKTTGRAYVRFAISNPGIFRLMFGANGLRDLAAEADLLPHPSAYEILGGTLDDLTRAGILPTDRRPGAELKAWTVVHGFASLVLERPGLFPSRPAREEALEAVLDFAVDGLRGDAL